MYDLIILGGGPAGLAAGLYACRSKLDTAMIEKMYLGGQIVTTYEIENYPGYEDISGPDLINKMEAQTKRYGLQIYNEEVVGLDITGKVKKVNTGKKTYEAKSIILAMGATPKELGLEKEKKFRGSGVSYCATCDGAFYKDQVVAVIGGGDTAMEDANYLTKFAKKVYVIHRRDQLRASKTLQDRAFANSKIEFIWNTVVTDIQGEYGVEGLKLKNVKTNEENSLKVDGMFVAIGLSPNTEIIKGIVNTDEYGYILTDEDMRTNVPGVFAAGDIRKKTLRQVVTATADGAIAAYVAERYIDSMEE
ncbi:thioredoxin-disulfide reductase [Thermoanaerobacterium sp. RBIITD]|uniref:thioredoxin-disulfide reductase n=1 Tax=Thermoanaerobacterium sp. RBIITD TaxID=1550240 RepID=UPI000BB850B4|nr:thioredoxin-disulfide reductase [Thermoanaerobacterium sp. RBIITD]SNX54423.1 thioredoxin reductase (NADPH) [Thermoanaerobacterium sp. RBIITD]